MRLDKGLKDIGRAVTFFAAILYILARLILITLMSLSLRSVPDGVYDVTWTRFRI